MSRNNFEANKMLHVYIHDYLLKKDLNATAQVFRVEAKVSLDVVAIDASEGFLYEWWYVFWDLYLARTNGNHSEPATSYRKAQLIKVMEQQQQQLIQIQQALQQQQHQYQDPQKMQLQQHQKQQKNIEEAHLITGTSNCGLVGNEPLTRQKPETTNAMATGAYEEILEVPLSRNFSDDAAMKRTCGENVGQPLELQHAWALKPSIVGQPSWQVLHGTSSSMSPQLQGFNLHLQGSTTGQAQQHQQYLDPQKLQLQHQQQQQSEEEAHLVTGTSNCELVGNEPLTRQNLETANAIATEAYEEILEVPLSRNSSDDAATKRTCCENVGQPLELQHAWALKPSIVGQPSRQVLHGTSSRMSPQLQGFNQQLQGSITAQQPHQQYEEPQQSIEDGHLVTGTSNHGLVGNEPLTRQIPETANAMATDAYEEILEVPLSWNSSDDVAKKRKYGENLGEPLELQHAWVLKPSIIGQPSWQVLQSTSSSISPQLQGFNQQLQGSTTGQVQQKHQQYMEPQKLQLQRQHQQQKKEEAHLVTGTSNCGLVGNEPLIRQNPETANVMATEAYEEILQVPLSRNSSNDAAKKRTWGENVGQPLELQHAWALKPSIIGQPSWKVLHSTSSSISHQLQGFNQQLQGSTTASRVYNSETTNVMAIRAYEEILEVPLSRNSSDDTATKQTCGENVGQPLELQHAWALKPSIVGQPSWQVLHGTSSSMSSQLQGFNQQLQGSTTEKKYDIPILNQRAKGPSRSSIGTFGQQLLGTQQSMMPQSVDDETQRLMRLLNDGTSKPDVVPTFKSPKPVLVGRHLLHKAPKKQKQKEKQKQKGRKERSTSRLANSSGATNTPPTPSLATSDTLIGISASPHDRSSSEPLMNFSADDPTSPSNQSGNQ